MKQHVCDIRTVCRRLNDYRLTIHLEKCTFGVKYINDMTNAYTSAITSLANATFLAHPRSDVPIAVTSDASDSGIGAVIEQFVEGA